MARWMILFLVLATSAGAQRIDVPVTTATATGYPTQHIPLTMTPADVSNKHTFTMTGDMKEVIVVQCTGTVTRNVTLSSVAESRTGRTGDVTFAITPSALVVFGPVRLDGWRQTTGKFNLEADSTNVSFAVIRLP